jgi:hypothetical protein
MSEARELAEKHVRVFNERAWSRTHELYAPDLLMIEPAGTTQGIEPYLGTAQGFVAALESELKGRAAGRREIAKTDYQARGVLYLPDHARFGQLLLPKESDNRWQSHQRRPGYHRGRQLSSYGGYCRERACPEVAFMRQTDMAVLISQ